MSQFLSENQFEKVFRDHWKDMYLAAYSRLNDRLQAEDLIQDVFISIWERRESLDLQKNWRPYLLTAVKYQVMKSLSLKSFHQVPVENYVDSIHEEDFLDLDELYSLIEVEIEKLPKRAREIFKLNKIEGYSIEEIADTLNLAPQTVHNQLSIAMKALRKELRHISPLFFLWWF
ncbi:RNA polymerase sigma-70 factor [Algoriphagus sp. NBT04N3]|jgi:RNA polymerase sigma-70 factor (family 1)|uniref:RNA polymerase sigma-70 factor n=1 Tax=Algoriphagus sp. NBT04N3 TaxID=2705473 RepID=UPI001C6370B6|nr:RNA polymerase sigma-70 factor [Algoriphagus sp. NBT04N3]QYH38947.1 RNA polymerase sigma-70 factor [Algoriphagus sp. NBT04N3]